MTDVEIADNIAYGSQTTGGGLSAASWTCELIRVLFRNNSAGAGGAVGFGSATTVNISASSFIENKAWQNGGSLLSQGQEAEMEITSTTFQGSSAFEGDGGAIYMSGQSRLTLNNVKMVACNAGSNGGGVALRGESQLILRDVTIRQCQARAMGGGLLAAGDSVIFQGDASTTSTVLVEKNRAREGAGVCCMSKMHLEGQTTGVIQDNEAKEDGGGLAAFSSYAKLSVSSSSKLQIQNNVAGRNGGGEVRAVIDNISAAGP